MNRSYVAKACYAGKKPFLFGTIVLDARATDQEIRAAFATKWAVVSPHAMPDIKEIVPGTLFFKSED